jgi:sodium transport system permease protein
MALAIRCKTFKEAQASATVVILGISLLPLMTLFNQEGTAPWHLWVPALAQSTLMGRVLKGEALPPADVAVMVAMSAAIVVLGLAYVVRTLRSAALK